MLARLGFILYALSWLAAAPMITLMAYGWHTGTLDGVGQFASGFIAIAILLLGRGLYYLLAGR